MTHRRAARPGRRGARRAGHVREDRWASVPVPPLPRAVPGRAARRSSDGRRGRWRHARRGERGRHRGARTRAAGRRCCCSTAGPTRTGCGATRCRARRRRLPRDRARPPWVRRLRPPGRRRGVLACRSSPATSSACSTHLGVERAHVVGHDWGAALAWGLAAFAPDRVDHLVALSVGHPAAFRDAGFAQREKSWYMLLFQFDGVAERGCRPTTGPTSVRGRTIPTPTRSIADLAAPGALTASLNWYRANIPPERRWSAADRAPAGRGADDGCLEQRRLRPHRGPDDRLGGAT